MMRVREQSGCGRKDRQFSKLLGNQGFQEHWKNFTKISYIVNFGFQKDYFECNKSELCEVKQKNVLEVYIK